MYVYTQPEGANRSCDLRKTLPHTHKIQGQTLMREWETLCRQRKKKAATQEVMQKVVVLFIRCIPFSIGSSTVFAINKEIKTENNSSLS